jgi:hypothetical protein
VSFVKAGIFNFVVIIQKKYAGSLQKFKVSADKIFAREIIGSSRQLPGQWVSEIFLLKL